MGGVGAKVYFRRTGGVRFFLTRNGKWVAMDDPPKTPCERCAAKGVQAAHYHFHCPLQNWTEVELPEGAPTPNFVHGRGWEGVGGGGGVVLV